MAEYIVFPSDNSEPQLTDEQLVDIETFALMWGAEDESVTEFLDNFFVHASELCDEIPNMRAWRESHDGEIPIEVRCAAGVVMRELGFNVRLSEQVDGIQGGFITWGRRVDGSAPTAPFIGGMYG